MNKWLNMEIKKSLQLWERLEKNGNTLENNSHCRDLLILKRKKETEQKLKKRGFSRN